MRPVSFEAVCTCLQPSVDAAFSCRRASRGRGQAGRGRPATILLRTMPLGCARCRVSCPCALTGVCPHSAFDRRTASPPAPSISHSPPALLAQQPTPPLSAVFGNEIEYLDHLVKPRHCEKCRQVYSSYTGNVLHCKSSPSRRAMRLHFFTSCSP